MFGNMAPEERDEMMAKFRKGEVRVFITTNMLARGIDVPEVEIVINYDVPVLRIGNERHGDPETYLHRIGRAGRFGVQGIAITIYDRDEDKIYFDEIIDHFGMHDKVKVLDGPDHFAEVYKKMSEDV
jgi:ATP-dependent RNA helicase DDX19/DBP5